MIAAVVSPGLYMILFSIETAFIVVAWDGALLRYCGDAVSF